MVQNIMKDSNKYFRDIKKLFPIHGKNEKKYLKNIKQQIDEYENFTYEQLEETFGTPINVVTSYYETIDSSYLLKRINFKRIITYVCAICLLLVTLVSCYEMYTVYKAKQKFNDMFPITEETTITEDERMEN